MPNLVLLHIGDIVGKPGMLAVRKVLPRLIAERKIDFVVANGENTAGGVGITPELAKELLSLEVDVITSGNHIWRQRDIRPYIDKERRLLRPFNFPATQPGTGFGLFETVSGVKIGVLNLAGRVFMDPADSPFFAADKAVEALSEAAITLVDFHAEASSEKRALALYLEGRVTAVVGTHTHIQTADETLLAGHTAYITDVGMTGPHDSVIGMRKDLIMDRFVHGLPHAFKVAKNDIRFQAVLIEADRASGAALSIERVSLEVG
jgi:2',3'-cyclic-nucleotide 2'-phosphodiesterase